MYRITSDAGLDVTFTNPVDAYDILYAHLLENLPHRKVCWTIITPTWELPGMASRELRGIDREELGEFVEMVVTGLLWLHHRTAGAA